MKYPSILSLAFVLALFFSCQNATKTNTTNGTAATDSNTAKPSSQVLSVNDFEQALKKAKNPQLIDVRTAEEVAQGSIAGSINYDFYADDFNEKMKTLDPQKPTFLYCRSGGRSGKTAKILSNQGFVEVYDLEGGYTSWKASH